MDKASMAEWRKVTVAAPLSPDTWDEALKRHRMMDDREYLRHKPLGQDSTSVWYVTWGNTAVNLNPNWRQRIAIRLASARSKAKDAWAVFKGDKVAIDWDEY